MCVGDGEMAAGVSVSVGVGIGVGLGAAVGVCEGVGVGSGPPQAARTNEITTGRRNVRLVRFTHPS